MMTYLTIAALIAVAILGWTLYRRLGTDRIAQFNDKRRATSRMVSPGEFVDGNRHLPVALAVTQSMFFYENSDMQASLDLQWVREIEYDTQLTTGLAVDGGKVLRLRCFSQVFEFVIANDVVARWHMMMPPRRAIDAAVAAPAA
ncbi:MAG TPA: hypothetical protein VN380_20055 [Thermoanaerobaculia bacterium]|jgi:hypothetical protein|nr:hypothetical protein [Thermoanaerobaculia bacterium]